MATAAYTISSFLGGEWSKTSQGRFDKPEYLSAMNLCLNGFPVEQGAWTRRPGSRYGNHTRNGVAAYVITFTFQETSPYVLEFSAGTIRCHAGDRLATTNDAVAVSAISTASPAVVTTSTSHGWATGDQIKFNSLSTVDPLLQNRQFTVTVTDATHFSIADPIAGVAIDGSTLATFSTGNVERIKELPSPYNIDQIGAVRSVQAEQKSVLLHGEVTPQVITAAAPVGSADATFQIAPAQFFDGPYLDPVIGATITPASVSGIVGCTIQSPTWSSSTVYNTGDFVVSSSVTYQSLIDQNLNQTPATATFAWAVVSQEKVFGSAGFQASDIGRHVRLFSEPAAWASGTTYAVGDSVKYNNVYWTSIVGSNLANRPGLDLTKWSLNASAAVWTWGKITSLTGATATLVSPALGSTIGDFGSPALAFDGVTTKSHTTSAGYYGVGGAATPFYIGKNISAGQAISYVILYAPSDVAFWQYYSTVGTLTLNLRGKNTAPASSSDGVLLGQSANANNLPGSIVQIFSNDTTTTYKYIWVEYTGTQGISAIQCAQLQFYTTSAFSGTGVSIQILGPALLYTTAITTWRLGLFNATDGYPKCGTYHEGRLWISGMVSNRLDASALVDIYNHQAPTLFYFTPTLKDGTVSDACAISYTLQGPEVNAVFWLEPQQQGIVAGTQGGEWLVQATTLNSPLSPLNMQAHLATSIGCANMIPSRTDHTVVFIQKHKLKIMEYFADVFSGKFSAPNLAVTAPHLAARVIEQVAYQQEMTPNLWMRAGDGSLLGASYKRESLMSSQGPTFVGWHQHSLGSERVIESLCVGSAAASEGEAAGLLDTLTMVTNDTTTGVRHVEFLTKMFQEHDVVEDAWFVDSGIVPSVQQNIVMGGASNTKLSGLWHLNGKTVAAFIGGLDCGDYTVSSGALYVPYGAAGGLYTSAFAAAAATWVVGFAFSSKGQLLRPATIQQAGTRMGPALGKTRRSHVGSVLLHNTQGISFGTSFTDAIGGTTSMKPARLMSPGGTVALAQNELFSGVLWEPLTDGSSLDSMLCWQITRPYPATVVAIGATVQTQDQ